VHPRATIIGAGDGLPALLGDDLVALAPVYRFAAWARDNDFVSVRETLAKQVTERRQKGIVRGDVVRVIRGLLSGQRGTVQDVDPRGAMRVLVGKRTFKVDAADVERS
jgi:transcription antitermination factor NusG